MTNTPILEPASAGTLECGPVGGEGAAAEETAGAVLESLRAFRVEEIRREQSMVLLAVEWVRSNPMELKDVAFFDNPIWEELAALGCPLVDELTLPTFAEAAGMTELQARRLVGESVLLVYLLPLVWDRVRRGQLEVWRARKLAEECWQLSPEAIAYIDRNMSLSTARHTEKGRAGLIAEAMLRFMPEEAAEQEAAAKDERGVGLDWDELGRTGTVFVAGNLDLPDALDLEAAISTGAKALKDLGSEAPLDLRRSWALGDLARSAWLQSSDNRDLPGDRVFFHPDCACQRGLIPERPTWDGKGVPQTKVKMFIHLSPESLLPSRDPCGVPEVTESPPRSPCDGACESCDSRSEGTAVPTSGFAPVRVEGAGIPAGMVLTPDTVRGWFTRPTAISPPKITIRPVIDLAEHQQVDAYEVPDRMKEHVGLRDGGCVFPWCPRPARSTDCDHIIAWKDDGTGGPTCTCSLAPLCRRHHRAKTHADNHVGNAYTWWNYESLADGNYLWRGPKGSVLLRTNSGTYDVSAAHVSHGPRVAGHELPPLTIAEVLSRVAAAAGTAERVAESLPTTDDLAQRYPAAPEEKPFFAPRRRRRDTALDNPWSDQHGTPPPF